MGEGADLGSDRDASVGLDVHRAELQVSADGVVVYGDDAVVVPRLLSCGGVGVPDLIPCQAEAVEERGDLRVVLRGRTHARPGEVSAYFFAGDPLLSVGWMRRAEGEPWFCHVATPLSCLAIPTTCRGGYPFVSLSL